ncbi:hypothetical protein ACWDWO_05220 [Actinopolymorpha singaporensis]
MAPGVTVGAPAIDFPLSPLLIAGGMCVLAEVFRRGRLLSRDVEGLV